AQLRLALAQHAGHCNAPALRVRGLAHQLHRAVGIDRCHAGPLLAEFRRRFARRLGEKIDIASAARLGQRAQKTCIGAHRCRYGMHALAAYLQASVAEVREAVAYEQHFLCLCRHCQGAEVGRAVVDRRLEGTAQLAPVALRDAEALYRLDRIAPSSTPAAANSFRSTLPTHSLPARLNASSPPLTVGAAPAPATRTCSANSGSAAAYAIGNL